MVSKSVALVTMSVRGIRVGSSATNIVKKVIDKPAASASITISPVDLAKFNLPVFSESLLPAMVKDLSEYKGAEGKAWITEMAKHDAYILVIPEYNWGMAGGTKNAIDFLSNEWKGKPAAIVSYGITGGKTASEQVAHSLTNGGLKVSETRPALPFHGGPGPEAFSAAQTGNIGENTQKDWEAKADEILKAFDELKTALFENEAAN